LEDIFLDSEYSIRKEVHEKFKRYCRMKVFEHIQLNQKVKTSMEVVYANGKTKVQFVSRLQCQNNMKLFFRISEDGSKIELKHCASSKTMNNKINGWETT
jgi:hypothetical protein